MENLVWTFLPGVIVFRIISKSLLLINIKSSTVFYSSNKTAYDKPLMKSSYTINKPIEERKCFKFFSVFLSQL